MANKEIVEEVKNFIRFAVKNRKNREEEKKNWTSETKFEEFEEGLIATLTKPITSRKSDRSLCEYAQLVAKSKGVTLSESIGYWLVLLKI